jgi:hypothetical protein
MIAGTRCKVVTEIPSVHTLGGQESVFDPISLRVTWLLRLLRSVFTSMARSIMPRTALRNCLIVMVGVYASPTRAGDSEKLERWSQEFSQLALDAEFGPANGYVNKWVGEVRYSIESRPRESIIDEMVIGQFDRLQDVTGLKYVRTTGQDASFRILYLSSTERLAWLDDLTSQTFRQHLEKWHSAPNSPCTFTFTR